MLSGMAMSSRTDNPFQADSIPPGFDTMECGVSNTVFNEGEEIIYKIYYNWNFIWISAGEVRFQVKELEDQYHVKVLGRTYDSYDPFYRVRERYETYLDKETLLPDMFIRESEEGKYTRYNKFVFNQDKREVTGFQGDTKETSEEIQVEFETCMHDILSILYTLRNLDVDNMKAGDRLPINVFLEKKYPLNIRVIDKNQKKKIRGMGKLRTDVFTTELIAGEVFKEDDQMTAYVSTDGNRIPLMIESPLSVGKMKAVLIHHKGLKYPLQTK